MTDPRNRSRGAQQPPDSDHTLRPGLDASARTAALGPLAVSKINPRYFAVGSGESPGGRAIYLTGSHIWNNFQDGMGPGLDCAEAPEQLDFGDYLQFLEDHGHNFIRLWRWEQFKSQAAGGSYHLCMTPQPWPRTGPGMARDGKPKFDLSRFEPAYFERLRTRVAAAGDLGIYVAVMFFDGWALHLSPPPDNVEGHPFHFANNINGAGITSILDYEVLPLDSRVQAFQEAYIRKVVDTVHDLPNVLFEVANESSGGGEVDEEMARALGFSGAADWGDSTGWQYWVIDLVKSHEQQMGYDRHPIGITMQFPVEDQTKVNAPLYGSSAEWISPGYDDEIFTGGRHPMAPGSPPSRWFDNPPANDGAKVVITDTDHYAPGKGDALWAWKSFLRGHQPILMDFGIIAGVHPPVDSPDAQAYDAFEPVRHAMGDTLRYAQRVKLIEMQPRGDLSSTGFALANPGEEYLVLQPSELAEPFTLQISGGSYAVEWYSVEGRETVEADGIAADRDGPISFKSPFQATGPVVLYLRAIGHRPSVAEPA